MLSDRRRAFVRTGDACAGANAGSGGRAQDLWARITGGLRGRCGIDAVSATQAGGCVAVRRCERARQSREACTISAGSKGAAAVASVCAPVGCLRFLFPRSSDGRVTSEHGPRSGFPAFPTLRRSRHCLCLCAPRAPAFRRAPFFPRR